MEAHGVREHPARTVRGQFIRHALKAAVIDVILPAFAHELLAAAMAGRPLTRDMAGRATVYLKARTHYGIVNPTTLDGLRHAWRQVLDDQDLDAPDELSRSSSGFRTVNSNRLTAPPASTARSSERPTHPHPKTATKQRAAISRPAGAMISPPRARWPKRSSRRSSARARGSSSSSTRTSTCSRCSRTRQLTEGEAPRVAEGAGRGRRPAGCPIAASTDRRHQTSSNMPPLRDPAAQGADAWHQADRQAHARRAVRRPRLRHARTGRGRRVSGLAAVSPRAAPGLSVLEAVLERIMYVNEETGHTIARVATERTGRGAESPMCIGNRAVRGYAR